MAVNMHKEAAGSLAESDVSHADEIVQMDDEVDRFSLYMRRNLVLAVQNANILREMGLDDPADCLGYRAVISRIERIADHAVLIAKRVKFIEGKIDSKVMKKISNLSLEAVNVFEEAILALEKKNYEKAEH
ncbi:MAG: phosphate uptake regulator PhoU, partial [Nitrosopumilaceae archaeon]|nr:phosphate uptake regulator PhoU [Nitrosopumilaceae archaeon]NIX60299.1 phosphate uptake regulator PhoU [Nitrosopumilaceae archaeon]